MDSSLKKESSISFDQGKKNNIYFTNKYIYEKTDVLLTIKSIYLLFDEEDHFEVDIVISPKINEIDPFEFSSYRDNLFEDLKLNSLNDMFLQNLLKQMNLNQYETSFRGSKIKLKSRGLMNNSLSIKNSMLLSSYFSSKHKTLIPINSFSLFDDISNNRLKNILIDLDKLEKESFHDLDYLKQYLNLNIII